MLKKYPQKKSTALLPEIIEVRVSLHYRKRKESVKVRSRSFQWFNHFSGFLQQKTGVLYVHG